MIRKNIGTQGRIIRALVAMCLLAFAYFEHSWIALIISLFIFFEAYTSWCIVYQLIGKNSCPRD